jgi:uncharacterized protein YyaL (SSP411 family)
MQFISSEWQDEDGGFFSAYDADSEGEEGKFYTWQIEELKHLLPDPQAFNIFCAYYGVEEDGNWEHTNILWVPQQLELFCMARGLEESTVSNLLQDCRSLLLQHRNKRIRPLLDDKKLISWNALMITACCKAWAATADKNYLSMAEKATAFIESKLKLGDNYHHNYKNGVAANPAFLDDIACYIQALIYLQECTGNTQYLETAARLSGKVHDEFYDETTGFFFYTPQAQSDIIFRKKDMYDGATPSGNSLMAQNFFYLGTLLDKPEWKQYARSMTSQMKKLVMSYPGSFALWAQLLQWEVYGVKEIAIVGKNSKEVAASLMEHFIPDKVLQQSATGTALYPLLKRKIALENKTLLYLCYQFNCKKPAENLNEFIARLDVD